MSEILFSRFWVRPTIRRSEALASITQRRHPTKHRSGAGGSPSQNEAKHYASRTRTNKAVALYKIAVAIFRDLPGAAPTAHLLAVFARYETREAGTAASINVLSESAVGAVKGGVKWPILDSCNSCYTRSMEFH